MKSPQASNSSKDYAQQHVKFIDHMREMMKDIPKPVFVPLKSWPAHPHIRQAEINQLCAAPSFDVERYEREKKAKAASLKKPTLWV